MESQFVHSQLTAWVRIMRMISTIYSNHGIESRSNLPSHHESEASPVEDTIHEAQKVINLTAHPFYTIIANKYWHQKGLDASQLKEHLNSLLATQEKYKQEQERLEEHQKLLEGLAEMCQKRLAEAELEEEAITEKQPFSTHCECG